MTAKIALHSMVSKISDTFELGNVLQTHQTGLHHVQALNLKKLITPLLQHIKLIVNGQASHEPNLYLHITVVMTLRRKGQYTHSRIA